MTYYDKKFKLARFNNPPFMHASRERCLSLWALQFILQNSEFVHEGQIVSENGKSFYFGSTMITIKHNAILKFLKETDFDVFAALIRNSPLLNIQLMRIARLEAMRQIGLQVLGTANLLFSISKNKNLIQIVIDIEVPCEEEKSAYSRT